MRCAVGKLSCMKGDEGNKFSEFHFLKLMVIFGWFVCLCAEDDPLCVSFMGHTIFLLRPSLVIFSFMIAGYWSCSFFGNL